MDCTRFINHQINTEQNKFLDIQRKLYNHRKSFTQIIIHKDHTLREHQLWQTLIISTRKKVHTFPAELHQQILTGDKSTLRHKSKCVIAILVEFSKKSVINTNTKNVEDCQGFTENIYKQNNLPDNKNTELDTELSSY